MKKLLLIFITFVFLFSGTTQILAQEKPMVVFLVRHAEKVDSSRDPELSEAGKQRAVELAEMLKSVDIDYIHSTDYIRTRETAAPIARHLCLDTNLYSPIELETFSAELIKKGGRHLVVGHSNTTPKLVNLLGGEPGAPIVEKNEYDRLYVLTISESGKVNTVLMRYGIKFKSNFGQ